MNQCLELLIAGIFVMVIAYALLLAYTALREDWRSDERARRVNYHRNQEGDDSTTTDKYATLEALEAQKQELKALIGCAEKELEALKGSIETERRR